MDNSIATVGTDIYALGMTLYRMVNGVSDWNLFLCEIPNSQKLIKSGKLIKNLPVNPIVPDKVYKIIKKACNISPDKRYHSATEMRNAIERLSPLYNWKSIGYNHYKGEGIDSSIKEIYMVEKRNSIDIIVSNNGRKSSKESKQFNNYVDAEKYLHEYINQTTFS